MFCLFIFLLFTGIAEVVKSTGGDKIARDVFLFKVVDSTSVEFSELLQISVACSLGYAESIS